MHRSRLRDEIIWSISARDHGVTTIEYLDVAARYGLTAHEALALLHALEDEGAIRLMGGYFRVTPAEEALAHA